MSEKCPYHDQLADNTNTINKNVALLQKDIEYLRRDQEVILARFGKHVEDAEKEGGWHERMSKAEHMLESIDKSRIADKKAIEVQMSLDRVNGRWFMIGSGILSAGITTGAVKVWAVLGRIFGI